MRFSLSVVLAVALLATGAGAGELPVQDPPDPFAGVPTALAEALRGFGQDAPRWAYTQRVVQYGRKGEVQGAQASRFDPSQHYDVQWTLLEQDGKSPTERQQKKFRKERAKLQGKRQPLGELLQLPRAVLVADQPDAAEFLTYEVPLKPGEDMRLPPEKFQVFVKITRESHRLHSIDVKLRSNLRMAGIVNVKSGEAHLRFETVKPEYGPAISLVSASAAASVMFIPVGGRTEATRTDFKRVTPYDDRFVVKPGPLRTIDF